VDHTEAVRDFNRYYTARIGVLDDHYLGQRRPLGEARLLFEIGDRADLRDLRSRLGLDSGYLSRLLSSLQKQGLVTVRAHPRDGRVRVATLTDYGVRERADLDARSRAGVGVLLEGLTPAERDELVAAQAQVRRLVRRAGVTIAAVPDSSPEAQECLRSYAAELAVRFPAGYDVSALISPGSTESFLVAREGERLIGCVAWCLVPAPAPVPASVPASAPVPAPVPAPAPAPVPAPASPPASASVQSSASAAVPSPVSVSVRSCVPARFAEVRHLWVAPEARGLGLGRRLLERVEAEVAERGIGVVRLGTHSALIEAIGLYRSSGYREIPSYDSSPYNQLSFEKSL
jgi:DNA-binding MarR family transcriptional regulator